MYIVSCVLNYDRAAFICRFDVIFLFDESSFIAFLSGSEIFCLRFIWIFSLFKSISFTLMKVSKLGEPWGGFQFVLSFSLKKLFVLPYGLILVRTDSLFELM